MRKQGSFLIESIVSISLVVIGLLGIITLVIRSISLNNNVHSRFIAANLAAEGIEVVKNIIDTNIAQKKPWNDDIFNGIFKLSYNCKSLIAVPQDCSLIALSGNPNNSSFFEFVQPLLFNVNNKIYSYQPGGIPTPFKRVVDIKIKSASEIQVNSYVQWSVKGITQLINIEDHFYKWRQ